MKKNYLTLILISVTILVSGFTTKEAPSNNTNPIEEDCQNPFTLALGYNAFVRNEVILNGGDTEGPIALGGDLTMEGIITIAAQTAGSNIFNEDSEASSLVVNGRVFYNSGEGLHLNNGYVKVGDLEGSSIFDVDPNNAASNTRVTPSTYEAKPRIQVQRNQTESSVNQVDLIDFEAAFEAFEATSLAYSLLESNVTITSDNKISLAQNEVNVLNITGSVLESLPFLTFENTPNQTTPLIINVDTQGDFNWSVLDLAGIGDQEGAFIVWNFYNATTITLTGGSTIVGTLFAPTSYVVKNSSGNINGQVISDSYYHIQGELHQHIFDACIEDNSSNEICPLTVNAGEDQEICLGDEVTLTAEISGDITCDDCSGVFEIENTTHCSSNREYVLWLYNGNSGRFFSNIDVQWTELSNGTATLIGTVMENSSPNEILNINVLFSGFTETAPVDSPKEHRCNEEDTSDWVYYTEISGTISNEDGSWSIDISRRGEAFQLGNGANQTEEDFGRYGGSGWFNTTDNEYFRGDFNLNLANCTPSTDTEISYIWSTGETTQSITVAPDEDTTYTVTVNSCNDCTDQDEITVIVNNPMADAGEDREICLGESTTLTVEGEGDILWSTGETTASIEVSPSETTTYSVTITNGNCEAVDEVIVNVNDATVSIDPTDDVTICILDEITLTASEANNYLWSTGETTQSITVSPFDTTTYSVTVTNGDCEATDEITVFIDFCGLGFTESSPLYPTMISQFDTVFMDVITEKSQDQITATFYNASGRSLSNGITKNITKGRNTIGFNLSDISGLSSGIYFVQIANSEGLISTERIIIK